MDSMTDFDVKGEGIMKKRWNDRGVAEHYTENRFSHPVWEFMHKKEVGVVNSLIKPGMKILDLATGPARVAKDLMGDFKGTAVDYAEEMLEVAARLLKEPKLPKWTVRKEDAFNLSFPDNSFDLVISFRFVRHFEKADRVRIYKEVKRVLKDGGVFVFEALNRNMDKSLFKPENTGAADKSIYDELYTKDELLKELKENGFEVVKLVPNICYGGIYMKVPVLSRLLDSIDLGKCFQWEVVVKNEKSTCYSS
jgi:ubiquinone/menaquinone biosynthesis C-methylase UbiE